MRETVITLLAASGAALALALVVIAQALRARTRHRFEAMLRQVDEHLWSISDSIRDALDHSDEVLAGALRGDELTLDGLASTHVQRGYEAELEREVVRARTTQRPLSLVVVGVHDLADSGSAERVAAELTTLLGRVTRTSDTVVRRGAEELVVLLPDTATAEARRFDGRLRAELETSLDDPSRSRKVSTGVVEWKPNESSRAFDARAGQAVGRANAERFHRRRDALDLPGAG